jgi:hypothetical protein
MSEVKERILGAVTVMSEADAEKVWELIRSTFALANLEEDALTPDEMEIFKSYHNNPTDYQPMTTHADLLKELGL